MIRRSVALALVATAALLTSAHVGSPDVYFDGMAGPYGLRVIVRTPGVVPGQADVAVRVTSGGPVATVAVVPAFFNIGLKGAPPPDTAVVVSPGLYSAQVWLMRAGPYSLHVTVTGPAGQGTAIVPVVAVATRRLEFQRPMAVALIGAGLFLIVGAITILRAAAKESTLGPGETPDLARARRGWITAGTSTVLLVLAVFGGRKWWMFEDANYGRSMYRPWDAAMTVSETAHAPPRLAFGITDSVWRFHAPLIPDHGKLMHLFLIRYPQFDVLAHLHPAQTDSSTFVTSLPNVPAGHYRAYADIVFETGAGRTITADLDLGANTVSGSWSPSDPDDAIAQDDQHAVQDSVRQLTPELSMSWSHPRFIGKNADSVLNFTVRDASGHVAQLEPYMGMAAHAVVARDDGAIFIHLHPAGTVSLAAAQALALRQPGDTALGAVARRVSEVPSAQAMQMTADGTISFPYAFPAPGRYHVWVQVKSRGKILTGAFAAQVRP